MKKFIALCIGFISMFTLNAQNISDALNYSEDEIQGTARFRALSGAFGALGGDISAIGINPAGSAVFNYSHAAISTTISDRKNKTSYMGGSDSSSDSDFDLNQAGLIVVLNNRDQSSNWKKVTFGVAYDRTKNFENNWHAYGTNTNSIDSYFLDIANSNQVPLDIIQLQDGEYIEDAYADIGYYYGYDYQQAFLGFQSFIIEPESGSDTSYYSNISPGTFNQDFIYSANGYNGKVSFNLASQYNDNLYLGINLNAHFIDQDRFTGFYETNTNASSLVTNVEFENVLKTTGNGFSFQVGAITKLTPELRLGISYNSPTWLNLEEKNTQYINTNQAPSDIGYISDIVNVFPDYKLRTPSKITGSLAYVFGDYALISFDYSYKDYDNIKFKPSSELYFSQLNNSINDNLQGASIYRIGGEYRYKAVSFRGGYRFEESPYKDGNTVGDLNGYSLGLGYSFGNISLDLTYDASERDTHYQLFDVGLTDSAKLNTKNSNVTLSLTFDM